MASEALSQRDCWLAYDRLLQSGAARFEDEPPGLEIRFRELSTTDIVSPKSWADAYLSAFAEAAGLTLITFDQSLHRRTKKSVLLR
jgi:predicted nucleic acid-binding protein